MNCASFLAVPEEALEIVERTGIGALAIAIGIAHGFCMEIPFIELEILYIE